MFSEHNAQNLTFKLISGAESYFDISALNKITFNRGNMQVHESEEILPTEFSLNKLQCAYFNDTIIDTVSIGSSNYIACNKGEINIYPNPIYEDMNIEYSISRSYNEPILLVITSMYGSEILLTTLNTKSNSNSISLSGIPEGLYMAHIVIGNAFYSKKIIKK